MDEQRCAALGRIYAAGREYDAGQADRLDRLRNLEPESAQFLHLQVSALNPANLLELGTSNGYSTLWLADACERAGIPFVTVELDAGRAAQAADNLRELGLDGAVEQRVADIADVLAAEGDASRAMIFLDAERTEYVGYWPQLVRVLRPGGLLVVDNCVSHAEQVADFRALVDADPRFESALVPIGAGLLFVHKAA